uniref:Uncharacterized protein n=1 Tax=Theropithecus gelada TaxID=9565 RepID=A0A8D2GBP2_THEGE
MCFPGKGTLSFSALCEDYVSPECVLRSLGAFELGATLFWGPQKTPIPELFRHGPVDLAVLLTGLEFSIKLRTTKNSQERLGLFIAPGHTCCWETKNSSIRSVS